MTRPGGRRALAHRLLFRLTLAFVPMVLRTMCQFVTEVTVCTYLEPDLDLERERDGEKGRNGKISMWTGWTEGWGVSQAGVCCERH